jgi:prepilin-type N-terminal cleavage/methylation domain-containing protein
MKLIKNEKGVTLIEVLAAVVILSIVLGSIMNFFPQMGFMNKGNGDKSQAINISKQDLIKWQKDVGVQNFLASNGTGTLPTLGTRLEDVTLTDGSYYHFGSTEGSFGVDIYINKVKDNNLPTSTDPNISIRLNKAYFIKIQVSNTKGTVLTENYGYIIF